MKHKGALLAILILGIYTWFTWPKTKPADQNNTLTENLNSQKKPVEPRVPVKDSHKKVFKEVPHLKNEETHSLRLDPDVKLKKAEL